MIFILFFGFLCVWGSEFVTAQENTTYGSFIRGLKYALTAAAEGLKRGLEMVPGLANLIFGDCVEPPRTCPNKNITFWYYSNYNPVIGVQIPDLEEVLPTLPRSRNPWKILLHGYTKSKDEIPNPELKAAYFTRGQYNIISVDYSPLAQSRCYAQAVNNVPLIARCTARFLDRLMDGGYFTSRNLHIIGFSLGAQIAGQIHNYLRHGKPYRVTALDPANPLFDGVINDRLTAESGEFVDVIHTNALANGEIMPSGHVDFYLNGGYSQPGCLSQRNNLPVICSHDRSVMYFAESINSREGFWGVPCKSYATFKTGVCNTETEMLVRMGEDVPLTARGVYYLQTADRAPYALGKRTSAIHL